MKWLKSGWKWKEKGWTLGINMNDFNSNFYFRVSMLTNITDFWKIDYELVFAWTWIEKILGIKLILHLFWFWNVFEFNRVKKCMCCSSVFNEIVIKSDVKTFIFCYPYSLSWLKNCYLDSNISQKPIVLM